MSSLRHLPRSQPTLSSADRSPVGVSLLLPGATRRHRRRQPARIGMGARRAMAAIGAHARADGIYLVPLRLFIGLGWLRTFLEKAIDPAWRDGTGVAAFMQGQLARGEVAFPFYETLLRRLFLPHALGLGWTIVIGELLVGMAILIGCCTRAALWGGLFMNLNFLLAGVPNPSAFYIAIQATLLFANTGAIVGVDGLLGGHLGRRLGARRWPSHLGPSIRRWRIGALALLALATAAYAGASVTDISPAGSVRDPAMILAILAVMGLLWSLLALLRPDPARGD